MSEALVVRRPQARTGTAPPIAAPEVQPPAPLPGAGLAAPGWTSGATPALTLGGVQRKPVLGRPGDAYEQEADAVADRVAGGLDAPAVGVTRLGPGGPAAPPQPAPAVQAMEDDGLEEAPASPAVQSMDAGGADDEPPSDSVQLAVDRQFGSAGSPGEGGNGDEEEKACDCGGTCAACGGVQRSASDGAAPTASMQQAASTAIASPGGGAALPGATRGSLETHMGVDLGGVRVHDGPDAGRSAAQMHARAFTHGRHIWLGRGESAGDMRLMAHEVTHVLQQDGVVRRKPADQEPPPPPEPEPLEEAPPAELATPPAPSPPAASAAPVSPTPAAPAASVESPAAAEAIAAAGPVAPGLAPPPPAPEPVPTPEPVPVPEPVAPPAPAPKPAAPAPVSPAPAAKPAAPPASAAASAPAAKPAAPAAAAKTTEAAKPGAPASLAGPAGAAKPAPAAEAAAEAPATAGVALEAPGESMESVSTETAPGVTEIPVPEAGAEPVAVEGEKPAEEAAAAAGGAAAAPAAKEGAPGAGGAPAGGGGGRKAAPAAVELLMPEPRSALNAREKGRLGAVDRKAGKAVDRTTDLPEAGTMTGEARGAVEEPRDETDARAGDALVEALGARPAPSPEIEELCVQIRKVIRAKRPPDEDALVEAKPAEMAKDAGGQLNENVEGDAQRVQGQYDQLQTQPTGTPQQVGQAMDEPPGPAEPTKLGAPAAIPEAVPPEEVSLDADVAASEQRRVDAGMETEPAKLVQDGPIAEARAAQGELVETAARDPQEVLAEQQGVLANASADMAGLQASALAALKGGRKETTTEGRTQQTGMVGSEEQMRIQAAGEAKAIFTSAQTRVSTLLDPLSRTAMAKWDAGVKVLSTEFEQQLAKVKKWVDERHESTVLAVWDYVTGLPKWVTREYDRAETKFGDGVCDLILEISTEVNGIIASAEAIIDESRAAIDKVFADLPDALDSWAAEQRAQFGARLDGLQQKAESTREDFTRDLTQKAAQAVQDVRQKIHELREAAKGLIGRIADAIGEFLDDPIKFIINGLLKLVGIAPSAFWALVNRIGEAIGQIADDPLGFANNLMDALGQGFTQFFDNIGTHLLNGLMEWLFSGLGSVGVQIPADFSVKSIVTFFLQLMGLSWANIRKILAKHVGEENIALIEKAWELISSLIEMGPEGLFEMIKEQLDPASLLNRVLEAATEYLVEALIKAVTPRILLMFNPAGAILQAIEAIFRVLQWIFQNAARIFSLVETIVNGVTDLIAGNIGGMANAIEKGLAKLIPPVIDFLASYLGLGGLPEAIADVIKGFQEQVLAIVDRIIGFLVTRAKGLLAALTGKKADEKAEEKGEPTAEGPEAQPTVAVPFDMEGAGHTITLEPGADGEVEVWMASGQRLPLAEKFAAAHTRLDNLRRYIATIQDPDVLELFREEFGDKLDDLPGDLVARFKAVYQRYFPRPARGEEPVRTLGDKDKQRATQEVTALMKEAQALTTAIGAWGDEWNIPDLSSTAVDTVVQEEGNRLWSRAWQEKRMAIQAVLAKHQYQGQPVEMRGSAQKGFRGDPKARTRFDESDFDVDLYVVHPVAFAAAVDAGARVVAGKIFPQPRAPGLGTVSDAVVADLVTAFPTVPRVAESDLVLREVKPFG